MIPTLTKTMKAYTKNMNKSKTNQQQKLRSPHTRPLQIFPQLLRIAAHKIP